MKSEECFNGNLHVCRQAGRLESDDASSRSLNESGDVEKVYSKMRNHLYGKVIRDNELPAWTLIRNFDMLNFVFSFYGFLG